MLRDEIAKYSELTGEDGSHTSIMKIGAYLDGYEKGLSVLDKIRAEIMAEIVWHIDQNQEDCAQILTSAIEIIDKYRNGGE